MINDAWATQAGAPHQSATYGQTYDYTTTDQLVNGREMRISSGVAAYEPLLGGDVNPLREPVFFDETNVLAPDNKHYLETPFGEAYFPAPTIIYSRVTVSNYNPNPAKITRTTTGQVVHEYYTARDFPTKTNHTGLAAIPKKTRPLLKLLKVKNRHFETYSQGYRIELNDMHGKPKAQWVYDGNGTQLSGAEYWYKLSGANELSNEVQAISADGTVTPNAQLGLDFDLIADSREAENTTTSAGAAANVDVVLIPGPPPLLLIPVPIPTILPKYTNEQTRFRSMALTKVIRRNGILEKTIARDLGSKTETENQARDEETGAVLLTRTANEFEDDIYALSIPAHFATEVMQAAYQNVNAEFNILLTDGKPAQSASLPTSDIQYFTKGDEVMVGNRRGWIIDVDRNTNTVPDKIFVVDRNGQPMSGVLTKVIRSGHRNMPTTEIGTIVSLNNPIQGNQLDFSNPQVVNAGAVEYDENWQTYCGDEDSYEACNCTATPENIELQQAFLDFLTEQVSASTIYTAGAISQLDQNKPHIITLRDQLESQYSLASNCSSGGNNIFYYRSELDNGNLRGAFGFVDQSLQAIPGCEVGTTCFVIPNFEQFLQSGRSWQLEFTGVEPDPYTCQPDTVCLRLKGFGDVDSLSICGVEAKCFPFFEDCTGGSASVCGIVPGMRVNPYQAGIWGNMRPKRSYTYLSTREQNVPDAPGLLTAGRTNIRKDGAYTTFSPFWTVPNGNQELWQKSPTGWTYTGEATVYNPHGNQIESKDALGIYSAELLGYKQQLVTTNAVNACLRQIAFEGFEDYRYNNVSGPCQPEQHFGFPGLDLNNGLSTEERHTGKYSLEVPNGTQISTSYPIAATCADYQPNTSVPFELSRFDCIPGFSPIPGKYVFSAWLKESSPFPIMVDYKRAFYRITVDGTAYTFRGQGQIVEGWQRV